MGNEDFVHWISERQLDGDFSTKIILSGWAYFHLDGLLNRQNCRSCGSENPRVIVQKQIIKHPKSHCLVCLQPTGDIITLFFLENAVDQALTVKDL